MNRCASVECQSVAIGPQMDSALSLNALVTSTLTRRRSEGSGTRRARPARSSRSTTPVTASEQIIDVVRAVGKDIGGPDYRDCAFLNAHAEFPGVDHLVSRACVLHVTHIRNVLRQFAREANSENPDRLVDRLTLVVNGLRASGPVLGRKAARCAVELARHLVEHDRGIETRQP